MNLGVFLWKMRPITLLIAAFLVAATGIAQPDRDFSGTWKLNSAKSNLSDKSVTVNPTFRAEQSPASLTVFVSAQEDGPSTISAYPLDGRSEKSKVADAVLSTVTKWEGSALLVNTIVSGRSNYTVMERWKRSADGNTLTIRRTIVRNSGESESTLVYENPVAIAKAQPAPEPAAAPTQPTLVQPSAAQQTLVQPSTAQQPQLVQSWPRANAQTQDEKEYVVTGGTRILLRLTNSVNTKRTAPGDHVYLQTVSPVFIDGRLVIPAGSYVTGTVTESKRAGKVKGLSALNLQFESITLSNGVIHDLRSRAGSVDSAGNLDRAEGRIKGEGTKGRDAGTVAKTTAAGTGIGAVLGGGKGAGIGAAVGAAAGLAGVLGSRGNDVVLPQGTTMELVVDRDLVFTEADLRGVSSRR